jgi:transcriptional regulator with XRE-family HTH domain
MDEINKRLHDCFIKWGGSYRKLAAELGGMSQTTLHRYINGRADNIPLDLLKKMAKVFKVTPEYLLGWDASSPASPASPALSPDEAALLDAYRELSDQGKQYVLQTVDLARRVYMKSGDYSPDVDAIRGA